MSEATPDSAQATPWTAPAIDGSDGTGFLTAKKLEEIQRQAYEEAYAEGLEAGRQAGSADVQARAKRLDELLEAMVSPMESLDEEVEQQLVELASMVVRQLFRREIEIEPTHVIGVVREALQLLPIASREIRVLLHPDDARLVQETLSPTEGQRAWSVVEDPLISRGGCQVVAENSRIDATAEARLNSVVGQLLGSRREQ
ncbi:MAG: FliH/SctL family protein [Woeseiaceae bacterium]|nr:FliH/SctL family protein [Woeseiaceae bacterium]